jgi:hypothetical protein
MLTDEQIIDTFIDRGKAPVSRLKRALEKGEFDPNQMLTEPDEQDVRSPLMEYAIGWHLAKHVRILVNHGARTDIPSERWDDETEAHVPRFPPLNHLLVAGRHRPEKERLEFFKVLLECGFDPCQGLPGYNFLTRIALTEQEDDTAHTSSRLLVEHMATMGLIERFSGPDDDGQTPFEAALSRRQFSIAASFVHAGLKIGMAMDPSPLPRVMDALEDPEDRHGFDETDAPSLARLVMALVDAGEDPLATDKAKGCFIDRMARFASGLATSVQSGLLPVLALVEKHALRASLPEATPAPFRKGQRL